MNNTKPYVLQRTSFFGKVFCDEFSFEINFHVFAEEDCRLQIDPLEVSVDAYCILSSFVGEPGQKQKPISLTGESDSGQKFVSTDTTVSRTRIHSNAFFVTLRPGAATIVTQRLDKADGRSAGIQISLRGFRSFRPKPVNAKIGRVIVQGNHKISSKDDVSGQISVVCVDNNANKTWFDKAESLAYFVKRGLEFAHGGRLQAPLIQVFHPDTVHASFYSGSSRPAHLRPIHHLDQSEFISALVERFERSDPFPDVIWDVVGWMNVNSPIDEVHFMSLMTAVEIIADNLLLERQNILMPKQIYKMISERLCNVLETLLDNEYEKKLLIQKIKSLNRITLSQKLLKVARKYHISYEWLCEEELHKLVKQRNSIAHTGRKINGTDLFNDIKTVRELISVIVLNELKYEGIYESYVKNYERRKFQPVE